MSWLSGCNHPEASLINSLLVSTANKMLVFTFKIRMSFDFAVLAIMGSQEHLRVDKPFFELSYLVITKASWYCEIFFALLWPLLAFEGPLVSPHEICPISARDKSMSTSWKFTSSYFIIHMEREGWRMYILFSVRLAFIQLCWQMTGARASS